MTARSFPQNTLHFEAQSGGFIPIEDITTVRGKSEGTGAALQPRSAARFMSARSGALFEQRLPGLLGGQIVYGGEVLPEVWPPVRSNLGGKVESRRENQEEGGEGHCQPAGNWHQRS
jgi:hypothetical protein